LQVGLGSQAQQDNLKKPTHWRKKGRICRGPFRGANQCGKWPLFREKQGGTKTKSVPIAAKGKIQNGREGRPPDGAKKTHEVGGATRGPNTEGERIKFVGKD